MKKRIVSILLCVALACANSSMAHGSELPESDYAAGTSESLSEESIPTELISEDFAETTGTAQEPGTAIGFTIPQFPPLVKVKQLFIGASSRRLVSGQR